MVKKIVVFGSYNVDMFFDIPNINFFVNTGRGAEDALHFSTHKQEPGGKGANQAVAAAKAGAKVSFYGAVGKGAHGRYLLENFRNLKINTKGIKLLDAPTGLAVIFNKPDGKHKAVVSHGANDLARQKDVPDSALTKNTILVLQAETSMKENAALMQRARKRDATVVFNVAPATKVDPKTLTTVDYLVLNRPEAEVIAVSLGLQAGDISLFAQTMARRFDLMCIVTLGELGVMAHTPDTKTPILVPSLAIKAVDTIGAGDAFVGAFSAALAAGIEPEQALYHGAVAGSLACTRLGAQTSLPTAKEIAKHLPKLKRKTKA